MAEFSSREAAELPALLVKLVRELARPLPFHEVTRIVRESGRQLVNCEGIAVVVREGNEMRYVDEDAVGPLFKGKVFPLDQCISGHAVRERAPIVIPNIYADQRIRQETYRPTFVKSLLMVPVRTEDPLGAIGVYWAHEHEASKSEIETVQIIADATAVALENARLFAALTEQRRTMATLIDNLPGVVYRLRDGTGWHLDYISSGCQKLTGLSASELMAKTDTPLGKLVHPEDLSRVEAESGDAVRNGRPYRLTYRLLLRDGREKWVTDHGCGVYDEQGMAVAREGFISDVTETRRLEQQLSDASKLDAMGRLAAGVAHDTNNILTSIIVTADLARRALPAGPLKEDIDLVFESAERAAGIMRQLLAFGRRQVQDVRVVDANAAARQIRALAGPLLGPNVGLRMELSNEPAQVRFDPARLEQVLLNLVLNSRDALPNGGTIEIRTERLSSDDSRAHRAQMPRGPKVLLSVADDGMGMSSEQLSHLFEPFFTTKGGRGNGLGLATVYGAVTQANGQIEVHSAEGQGTRFDILLAQTEEGDPAERTRRNSSRPPVEQPTVLLVDDNRVLRDLLQRVLSSSGYEVLTASDGLEALAVAERALERLDAVVTDIVMPNLSGIELSLQLREKRPDLSVVLISGYAEDPERTLVRLKERYVLLDKPFKPNDLVKALDELLRAREPKQT